MQLIIKVYFTLVLMSCGFSSQTASIEQKPFLDLDVDSTAISTKAIAIPIPANPDTGKLERKLLDHGLVDVKTIIPESIIELKYTTEDNFVGIDLYGDLEKIYLQPDVAQKLKRAHDILQKKDSNLTFIVFDGARPHFVQKLMWDSVDLPMSKKSKFLSNPKNHSIHNYGAAIDISLYNTKTNQEVDMATPYDDPALLAYPRLEQKHLASGAMTKQQYKNRLLLRSVMKAAGFKGITTEWWHFNSCSRAQAKAKYKLIH